MFALYIWTTRFQTFLDVTAYASSRFQAKNDLSDGPPPLQLPPRAQPDCGQVHAERLRAALRQPIRARAEVQVQEGHGKLGAEGGDKKVVVAAAVHATVVAAASAATVASCCCYTIHVAVVAVTLPDSDKAPKSNCYLFYNKILVITCQNSFF